MRAVLQRVRRARVEVAGGQVGSIGPGLLVFLGVRKGDGEAEARYLAGKVLGLRLFPDEADRMQYNVLEAGGEVLVVSQFTLYGDCRKGRRPDFTAAAPPEEAEVLYHYFMDCLRQGGARVAGGRFRAMMDVELVNDGPVTLLLDSARES